MNVKTSVLFLCVAATIAAEEVGQQPLQLDESENTKEKAYKKVLGEGRYDLPFRGIVNFKDGQTLHIAGQVDDNPDRIDVSLIKNEANVTDENEVPLHLSIRFDEGLFSGKIVHNTRSAGNWSENEERVSSPFKKSEPFDLRLRLVDGKYKLFGNRKELGSFEQREQLGNAIFLRINGSLATMSALHYGGAVLPNPYTAVAPVKPGKRVDISGVPTGKKFNVNLFRKDNQHALQLSVRYSEGVIVRNGQVANEWGKEEREGKIPLAKGEVFDLTVINEKFGFQIFVNGQRFAAFAHRGEPADVETLGVDGDVELHSVSINDA